MTRGSCLTFQLSVPSRQQPHPMAKWELGLGQRGGSGAASQAPLVWVSLAWDGAAGRLNRAGHGGRQHPSCCLSALHPYTTVLHFYKPWGLSWHRVSRAMSLGWDFGSVPGSCSSPPASRAARSCMQTWLS